jgi:hypothetical protein
LVLSPVYGCLAAPAVAMMAIRTCSMQPDVAAMCDATLVYLTALAMVVLYFALAFAFFRHRISGVD